MGTNIKQTIYKKIKELKKRKNSKIWVTIIALAIVGLVITFSGARLFQLNIFLQPNQVEYNPSTTNRAYHYESDINHPFQTGTFMKADEYSFIENNDNKVYKVTAKGEGYPMLRVEFNVSKLSGGDLKNIDEVMFRVEGYGVCGTESELSFLLWNEAQQKWEDTGNGIWKHTVGEKRTIYYTLEYQELFEHITDQGILRTVIKGTKDTQNDPSEMILDQVYLRVTHVSPEPTPNPPIVDINNTYIKYWYDESSTGCQVATRTVGVDYFYQGLYEFDTMEECENARENEQDPPIPSHYCGDGICEKVYGEDTLTCPEDCPLIDKPPEDDIFSFRNMIIIGVAIAIILGAVVTFLFLKRRKANGKVKNKNNKK